MTERIRSIYRRLFIAFAILLAGLLGAFLITRNSVPSVDTAILPIVSEKDDLSTGEIYRIVNAERHVRNLNELEIDSRLQAVAQARADDLARNQYFSHEDFEGRIFADLFASYGFSTGYACENLAIEFTENEYVYVDSWLNSQSHRECLLNSDVQRAGYGMSVLRDEGEFRAYIVVAIFAAPPFEQLGLKRLN